MVLDLKQKTYFLITGASRGIGKTMAIQVAAKLKADSVVVLLARSEEGLAATKASIEHATNKAVQVLTFTVDLAKATAVEFEEVLSNSLRVSGVEADDFERAFIVHNAGTVGDVSKRSIDVADTNIWTQYYHMNLFSAIALNCEFFRVFAKVPKLVVNLSTLCAIKPFVSMSFYCSAKAAREMYFRVLAVEESKSDTLVLNYAPGAIDTDMTVMVQSQSINKELTELFRQQRESKTMLTAEQTSARFIKVLEERDFSSGDHVDYWD